MRVAGYDEISTGRNGAFYKHVVLRVVRHDGNIFLSTHEPRPEKNKFEYLDLQ